MPAPIRFWGKVQVVRPRLVLARFDGGSEVRCPGYIAVCDGTRTEGSAPPVPGVYSVVIGPATMRERSLAPGDLIRGDAHPVPEKSPDTPADLYKVGVFRVIARGEPPAVLDPPFTDAPYDEETLPSAPRRALARECLDGACARCPHAVVACIVRLEDPRDWRGGQWRQALACLGPDDCPHYVAPQQG